MHGWPRSALGSLILAGPRLSTAAHARRPAGGAAANAGEKGKALKAVVSDCPQGANGRAKVEAWVPQWMAFPPSAYTTRGGVGSVKSAPRVAHELAAPAAPEPDAKDAQPLAA